MTTSKQNTANKENARKSTGPKTAAGKARASMNAATHGLTAEKVVIPGEVPEDFEVFRQDVYDQFEPVGVLEKQLVERIAFSFWRLRRIPTLESATFVRAHCGIFRNSVVSRTREMHQDFMPWNIRREETHPDVKISKEIIREAEEALRSGTAVLGEAFEAVERPLNGMGRYEVGIERSLYRALQELERVQKERWSREASAPVKGTSRESLAPRKRTRSRPG